MAKKNPIELLISIISEVIELTKENKLTAKELKQILKEADIPPHEAQDIIMWFQNFANDNKNKKRNINKKRSNDSIRLFSTEEKSKIPSYCLNKLNELCLYKIITPEDRELILLQAMALKQSKLTDEHFHWICQMVMANNKNNDSDNKSELEDKLNTKDIISFILQRDNMEITAH